MLPDAGNQIVSFSADDIPEHHRNEFMRDFHGRIQMRMQINPHPEHVLQYNVRTLMLPGMTCTTASASPVTWERTSELMADSNDDIVITWNKGGYQFTMPGRGDYETRPGAAAIFPLDRRFSARTKDSRWALVLQFKRSLLAPLVKHIDDVDPDNIGRIQPAHCLLHDYLWSLMHMETPSSLAPMASRHIVDLLAASFGAGQHDSPTPGVRAARLAAIKRHIDRKLCNPDLSAEQVSKEFSISTRYIRQLFSEQGTSFSDYVAEKRLSHVYGCLTDPRQILRRIADIAFEVGFIEPSTFYRRFQLRYHMTPTDVRQMASGRFGDDGRWPVSERVPGD